MRTNTTSWPHQAKTHNGARARLETPLQQLQRAVLSCMLWENNFYESGVKIAERIEKLCEQVSAEDLSQLTLKASKDYMLRHIPLYLCLQLIKKKFNKAANVIRDVCNRPDQLCELLSLYWKDQKLPIPRQMKLGMKWAFNRFDEYQLAKWNRKGPIKLRDIAFLVHAKGDTKEQCRIYANLVNKDRYPELTKSSKFPVLETYGSVFPFEGLKTPDTWEVALSSGADKKMTWERLINEKKLGVMAALMNARSMAELGIEKALFAKALDNNKRMLPFTYIRSAKECPRYEDVIEKSMLEGMKREDKLTGKTLVLVDVSGSMYHPVSSKSTTSRIDIGAGFAMLLKEVCEEFYCGSFTTQFVEVVARSGFALRDAIIKSQPRGGTTIGQSLVQALAKYLLNFDRVIIITDEQSSDTIPLVPIENKYIINIGTDKNGVELAGTWVKISGFAEASIRYICELEKNKE